MPRKKFHQTLLQIPFAQKLLGIGALLMFISIFLPWYTDRDNFNTGDMFLGVTGPLWIVGYSILALVILNIIWLGMEIMNKTMPFFDIKFSTFSFFTGIFCFYLLIVVSSIYIHPKFGLNIPDKTISFGVFFAFIASSLITIGGYLSGRDKATILKKFEEKNQDLLLKLNQEDIRKPKENLAKHPHSDSSAPIQPLPHPAPSTIGARVNAPASSPSRASNSQPAPKEYQPFRTDL